MINCPHLHLFGMSRLWPSRLLVAALKAEFDRVVFGVEGMAHRKAPAVSPSFARMRAVLLGVGELRIRSLYLLSCRASMNSC